MKGVDPQGEDDENDDDILDSELVLRHPRVVPILRHSVRLTLFVFYTCGLRGMYILHVTVLLQ
jgi:hypothetical protein